MKTLRRQSWLIAVAIAPFGMLTGCTVNEDTKPDTTIVTPGRTDVVPVPVPVPGAPGPSGPAGAPGPSGPSGPPGAPGK